MRAATSDRAGARNSPLKENAFGGWRAEFRHISFMRTRENEFGGFLNVYFDLLNFVFAIN